MSAKERQPHRPPGQSERRGRGAAVDRLARLALQSSRLESTPGDGGGGCCGGVYNCRPGCSVQRGGGGRPRRSDRQRWWSGLRQVRVMPLPPAPNGRPGTLARSMEVQQLGVLMAQHLVYLKRQPPAPASMAAQSRWDTRRVHVASLCVCGALADVDVKRSAHAHRSCGAALGFLHTLLAPGLPQTADKHALGVMRTSSAWWRIGAAMSEALCKGLRCTGGACAAGVGGVSVAVVGKCGNARDRMHSGLPCSLMQTDVGVPRSSQAPD